MALEIKEIDNVICLKGKVSLSKSQELKRYFTSLLEFQDTVLVNLCQITQGRENVEEMLYSVKEELHENKKIKYFGFTPKSESELFKVINKRENYFQAA